jgi:hypothetical protein
MIALLHSNYPTPFSWFQIYFCCSQELSENKTSQQLLSAQDKHLATTSGTEGPGSMENEFASPMQIEKHMRWHNKPKKTQDYVVSPEGT